MAKLLGIDDAGRGPVIGSMVLAGVIINPSDDEVLKSWGAKDSKLLRPIQRKQVAEKIRKEFEHYVVTSLPKEIDASSNLNYLEAIKTAKIINHFSKLSDEKINVVVDCPSVNIQAWSMDVQRLLKNPEKVSLVCEHKADANYPAVSAASILAKEKREDSVKKLRQEFEIDFGSGYPADPKTKDFITKNFDDEKYKDIIRFSWNTVKKLVKAKSVSQKKLFE